MNEQPIAFFWDGEALVPANAHWQRKADEVFVVGERLLEGDGKDQGEKWEQKQINFSQLPELTRQFLQIASGAADIPVTRLLGEAPHGLNASSDGEFRAYYDNIAARQRTELGPMLHRLDEIIIRSATGKRDPAIHFNWKPLWSISEKEKADIFKTKADAARTIAGKGGMESPLMPIEALSDALVNELVEDGSLAGLEEAISEYGKLSEQEEDEADIEAAALPAPTKEQNARREASDAAPRTLSRVDVAADGTGSSTLWSTKSADLILRDVNDLMSDMRSNSEEVEFADSLRLPPDAFRLISTKRLGSGDGTLTVLEYLRRNNVYTAETGQPLDIAPLRELATASQNGGGRMVVYRRDPEVLRFHLPMPRRVLQPRQKSIMGFETGIIARTGGTEIRLPGAMAYGDEITPVPV